MSMNSHPLRAEDHWIVPLLLVSAVLQTLVTTCGLWAIGLFLLAGRSESLQQLVSLGTALATAILKVSLSLFGL